MLCPCSQILKSRIFIISKTKLRKAAPIANLGVNRRVRHRRVDSCIDIVKAIQIDNTLSVFALKEPNYLFTNLSFKRMAFVHKIRQVVFRRIHLLGVAVF
jgi:hypothetical protein